MPTLLQIPASFIHLSHSLIAFTAFISALVLACWLHYEKVVKNGIASWPDEWLPSVSASIGDWAPERPTFQILIALCSGPRFLLILLQWLVTRQRPRSRTSVSSPSSDPAQSEARKRTAQAGGLGMADWVALIGVGRTFCCGGWVYVTSNDNHDFHDLAMIAYLVLTLPWMVGTIILTPSTHTRTIGRRKIIATTFHTLLIPLIYFFIQHKINRIPGAYSYYAIFEWALVFVDVIFDGLGWEEVRGVRVLVVLGDEGERKGVVGMALHHLSRDREDLDPIDLTSTGFKLGEPIWVVEDMDMTGESLMVEYPAEKAGWMVKDENLTRRSGAFRFALGFIADVYLAMTFWSIFASLGLQLFYFSVWQLALSGSELALLAILSPLLLSIPSASRFATSRSGASVIRIVALGTGLGAYRLPGPATRLIAVVLGNIFGWLGLAAQVQRLRGGKAAALEGTYLMLGLLVSLVLKLMNNSVDPFWCIVNEDSGGWNKTGLFLAGLACAEKAVRPLQDEPQAPVVQPVVKENDKQLTPLTSTQIWSIASCIGSLLFLIQTFVSDLGTIIAWNWSGYPANGPRLLWQGGIVAAAIGLGLVLRVLNDASSRRNAQPYTIKAYATGILACYILCWPEATFNSLNLNYLRDWGGFAAGCVLVSNLVYLFPALWQDLSRYSYEKNLLGRALLILVVLDVVSVITVAYAFVPGGQYVREKTPGVVFLASACVFNGCTVLSRLRESSLRPLTEQTMTGLRVTRIKRLALPLALASVMTAEVYSRLRRADIHVQPYQGDSGVWTGGIWTVHFGVDLSGRDSQKRMMDLIRDAEVDVIGLLESDLHRFVYGNRDLTRKIAEELGYYVDLGPGPNKHTWGAALLSKFPILESHHHLLPSPHGELAPAIHAKLLIKDQVVNVIVSHNGQEEDALDRQLQTEAIANISNSVWPEPVAFLGYVVTKVGASRPAPYEILMADGKLWDVEYSDFDRWCEYIAFRNMWRIGYARISHGHITDTELQIAKFFMDNATLPVDYETNQELYFHTHEAAMPTAWHFPQMFRGEGIRGHRYHVFDGPVYYMPPVRFWDRYDRTHWDTVNAKFNA